MLTMELEEPELLSHFVENLMPMKIEVISPTWIVGVGVRIVSRLVPHHVEGIDLIRVGLLLKVI